MLSTARNALNVTQEHTQRVWGRYLLGPAFFVVLEPTSRSQVPQIHQVVCFVVPEHSLQHVARTPLGSARIARLGYTSLVGAGRGRRTVLSAQQAHIWRLKGLYHRMHACTVQQELINLVGQ